MKRLLILLLTFSSLFAAAQTQYLGTGNVKIEVRGGLQVNGPFRGYIGDTTFTPYAVGVEVFRLADTSKYVSIALTGKKWDRIGKGITTAQAERIDSALTADDLQDVLYASPIGFKDTTVDGKTATLVGIVDEAIIDRHIGNLSVDKITGLTLQKVLAGGNTATTGFTLGAPGSGQIVASLTDPDNPVLTLKASANGYYPGLELWPLGSGTARTRIVPYGGLSVVSGNHIGLYTGSREIDNGHAQASLFIDGSSQALRLNGIYRGQPTDPPLPLYADKDGNVYKQAGNSAYTHFNKIEHGFTFHKQDGGVPDTMRIVFDSTHLSNRINAISGGGTVLNGTGFVKMSGTTPSYDNTTYEPAFTKLGAFNKNFGTTIGTVAEGNHTHSGYGTVTSVSVTTGNGLSGSVTTSTTTPAITLGTTVTGIVKGNGTGFSAAVAADFPTLNQNTTGNAATATTATSATTAGSVTGTNVVANTNLAQMPANTLKGNNTGGTANATDLNAAQVRTMLGITVSPYTSHVAVTANTSASTQATIANAITLSASAGIIEFELTGWNGTSLVSMVRHMTYRHDTDGGLVLGRTVDIVPFDPNGSLSGATVAVAANGLNPQLDIKVTPGTSTFTNWKTVIKVIAN